MAAPSKIIVTGAAQGLGRAVALRLAAPGHHVAVWDTKIDGAEETARLCRERGAVARAWTVDVGAEDQVEGAVADFVREWGLPDSLVANAGIFPRSRALDMPILQSFNFTPWPNSKRIGGVFRPSKSGTSGWLNK